MTTEERETRKMRFIQRELDRIGEALRQPNPASRYDELYAAQQALLWALEPETFKAPYDLLASITDTPRDFKRLSGRNRSFSVFK